MDSRLRKALTARIHSIVAAMLIVALVVGTICLMIFLSIRIGQESSATAVAVKNAARDWTSSLQSRQSATANVRP